MIAEEEDLTTVRLRFAPGDGGGRRRDLGAAVAPDPADARLLVIKDISPTGLLAEWNAANAGSEICAQDRILSVNGQAGSAELLFQAFECEVLDLVVRRDFGQAISHLGVVSGLPATLRVSGSPPRMAAAIAGPEDEVERRAVEEEQQWGSPGELPGGLASGKPRGPQGSGSAHCQPRGRLAGNRVAQARSEAQTKVALPKAYPSTAQLSTRAALQSGGGARSRGKASSDGGGLLMWLLGCSAPQAEWDTDGPSRSASDYG